MKIAIIGGGIAGLACGQVLEEAGLVVKVFDKGRGPGGRMSTRHMLPWHFDHGAQYLTAQDSDFQTQLQAWEKAGVVRPWSGRLVVWRDGKLHNCEDKQQRYVGVPGMNAIVEHLAQDLEVSFNVQVATVVRHGGGWRLLDTSESDLGMFQGIVVALPAPQAAALLAAVPSLAQRAAAVQMTPRWSVMLGFAQPVPLPFEGAFLENPVLAWATRNNSKPGRPEAEAWVLEAPATWSSRHYEQGGEQVAATLLQVFKETLGTSATPSMRASHRWRYALALQQLGEPYLYDSDLRIGACGDWCLGACVESAWRSGQALANRILAEH